MKNEVNRTLMVKKTNYMNFAKRLVMALAVVLMAANVWSATWNLTTNEFESENTTLVVWSSSDATMTLAKGTCQTNANNYLGGKSTYNHTRVYAGQTLTISPASGKTITSIAITATSSTNNITTTWNNGSASASNDVVTITPEDGTNNVYCTCNSAKLKAVTVTVSSGCTGDELEMSAVTATPGDEQVTLSWDAVTGATKYQVKWDGGSWTDVNTNSYTKTGLTNGTEYTYQVKAIGNGTTKCDSEPTTSASVKAGLCYTVNFSTGENNPEVAARTETDFEEGITLPNGPTPSASSDGWEFAGWAQAEVSNAAAAPELFMPGDEYAPEENITLYAVYRKLTGGTDIASFTASDITNLTEHSLYSLDWRETASGVEMYISAGQRYTGNPNAWNVTSGTSKFMLIDAHRKIASIAVTLTGADYKINSVDEDAGTAELTTSGTSQTVSCSGNVTQVFMYATSNKQIRATVVEVTYYKAKFHSNPAICAVNPTVGEIMNTVSAISSTGATFSTSAGVSAGTGCDLTAVGFVYGSTTEPTLDDNVAIIDNYTSGVLNKSITGLTPNTKYYVRAYATNSHGTTYSDEKEFTTLQRYDITYNNNGGTGSIDATTKDYGANFTLPANAGTMTKTGYHIANWRLGSASGTSYSLGGTYDGNADAEFYASWESNPYQVIFHKNGGQGENMTNQSFNYDEAQNLKANTYAPAEGSHKYFTGWNTQPNGSGTPYADKASVQNLVTSGTITLYAQWADHTYTNYRTTCCTKYDITAETPENGSFTVKDGDDDVDKACATTTITIAATPASDSYVFNHWSIVDGESNDITENLLGENPPVSTSFEMPAKAITINAVFNLKTTEYAVTLHDNNGGEHNGSATVSTNGTVLSNISLPTKEGYHVAGYYLEAGCETLVANAAGTLQPNVDGITDENAQFIKGEAITLYAAWEGNQYTVTISKNYGSAGNVQVTATYDAAMPSITGKSISREGYSFAGVFANQDGTGTQYYNADKSSANNWDQAQAKTIYAAWTPKNYTIILNNAGADDGKGGTASISVTYDSNENLSGTPAITRPEKAGYKFCGYYTSANGEGSQIIDENGDVKASVSGYTSDTKQWRKAGSDEVNLYAFWKACHTVTWSVNGEETPEVVVHGEKVAAMPDPAPTSSDCDDAKKFVGWRAEKITGTSATNPGSIFTDVDGSPEVTDDVTFYAVFADVTGGDAIELTFPDDNSANNGLTSNQYTSTWTAKAGTFGFTIKNFNNNNWGGNWKWIKCGRGNSNASVASISTAVAVPFAVDSVLIEIEDIDENFINSSKLYISANSDFSSSSELDIPQSEATQKMVIASAAKNKYYKIEFDCKAKSNGFVQINSVVYKQKIDTSNYVTTCASCDEDATFTTALPAISDEDCTSATVTATGGLATLGSEGCNISDYGFVLGTANDPILNGEGVTKLQVGTSNPTTGEDFSQNLTSLTVATHYYVRAYAINRHGTAYSSTKDFWTNGVSSIVVTHAPSKTNYIVGETFDATGMEVTATLAGGATDDVTADVTYSSNALTAGASQNFTINYSLCGTEVGANQTINVYTLSVNEGTNADKGVASYTTGATFSVGSLAEHTTFNFDVTNGFVTPNGDGTYTVTPNGSGDVTVTVNYVTAVPVAVKFYVNGNELTGLAKNPYQSEEFDMPNASAVASAMTAASISVGDVNFVGWSTTPFGYQTSEPTLVGASVSVMEATNYYAVFTNVNVDKIRATDFNGGGYYTTKITINGNDYTVNNVMNTSGIQFKKNSGCFYATDELKNIVKVVIVGDALVVNACSDESGTIDGSAITPSGAGTTISPYIYTFPSNMQYLKIAGRSGETDHATIIDIYYAPEAVYYATEFKTLTFNKANGAVDKTEKVATGKTRTLSADDAPENVTGYTFMEKWSNGTNDYVAGDGLTVNADMTLNPYSSLTTGADVDINVLPATVTEIVVTDGKTLNVNADKTLDNLTVEAGGKVSGSNNLTVINNLLIKTSLGTISGDETNTNGKSGEITNGNKIVANGDVFIEIELTQDAEASYGWYAFSVPFPVDAMNGVYYGNTKLTNEDGYAIMSYHGDVRAQGQYAWKKYRGIMQPGVLYIIAVGDTDYKTLRFKKVAGADLIASNSVAVKAYPLNGGTTGDNGWNGIGNPNLQVSRYTGSYLIQFLDHQANSFKVRNASAVNLMVGSAFMMQSTATENITITAGNDGSIALAPAREMNAEENTLYEVKLRNNTTNIVEDNLFFMAREDATNSYETGYDLVKLSMGEAKCAQMYVPAYGTKLCAADFPLVNDKAEYPLTITAPADGTYRIEMPTENEDATLYLTKDGRAIWDLSMSACEVELTKGTTESYGLLLVRKAPGVATGNLTPTLSQGEGAKILIDEHVYILRGGQMYDVTGKAVK